MPLYSTILVPDLQYWFTNFILSSNLNKDLVLFPVTSLERVYIEENNSFIRLLFDDNWPSTLTEYSYKFSLVTNLLSIPVNYRTRLMVYPSSGKYYLCTGNDTGTDLFVLQDDDKLLLDVLLEYRLDSTSVVITDIDYSSLSTNLSKLIYMYLDLKINNNYTDFDNVTPVSDDTKCLECFYEMYVCENLFDYISIKGTLDPATSI